MRPLLFLTGILPFFLLASCGGSNKSTSSPGRSAEKFFSKNLSPVIDGNMSEWGETLLYDNNTKCIYSVANDNAALYIAIKSADRMQQMKIVQGGMEIWIDEKAKKRKSMGVRFPLGGGMMSIPTGRGNGNNGTQDSKELRQQIRQQMKIQMLRMELEGFKENLNGQHDIYSDIQVKIAIDWDDKDNMIYELAIPFATMNESVKANLNNISIGIFVKGLRMDQNGGGGMPGGGGRPAGGMPGGGRPGGMRPGGGAMPDQGQMENMSKDNSFWTKYTITKS